MVKAAKRFKKKTAVPTKKIKKEEDIVIDLKGVKKFIERIKDRLNKVWPVLKEE